MKPTVRTWPYWEAMAWRVAAVVACLLLGVALLSLQGCAHNQPPPVVIMPASATAPKPTWESKLWADIKILWPCIKELRLHPTSVVDDLKDLADMKPCVEQLKAVNAAVADAGTE